MLLKVGVNFDPHQSLRPILKAVHTICQVNNVLMIITSMKDRAHSPGSKHYYGQAFDLRKKHIRDPIKEKKIFFEIQKAISGIGKIIDEPTHWHIEVN